VDELFRHEVRTWLADNLTGEFAGLRGAGGPGREHEAFDERLAWDRHLAKAGWTCLGWPVEHGGRGATLSQQVIFHEEYACADAPARVNHLGEQLLGPTLIAFGTPAQCARFLPPIVAVRELWCQGYSEPGAGSDLPSLRTTAFRDGDEYVVTGQKVWTSAGPIGDILFTLVRTGAPDSRQHGISYLLIDMHAAGVRARPLRDLTGGSDSFSEVFLDEVRVPVADRVGPENGGWPLVRTSLGHERSANAMTQAALYRRVMDELTALARDRGVAADPRVRQRLAGFEIRVRIMRYAAERTIADILAHGEPGPASSVSRLFITSFEQELHEFAVDLLGPYGLLGRGDPAAVQGGRWLYGFLRTRASTIGAGTAEIQRNTVAEQVLALPRDPTMPPR
jgi:alkylation response protein AidB-like acyl-CoA dehydrogenase